VPNSRSLIALLSAVVLLATASLRVSAGANTAQPGRPVTHAVDVVNDSFQPATIVVKAGEKVTWHNSDDDPHTITSTRPLFDSGGLARDDSYSYVFRKPGTYTYYCKVHPFMKGTVVVKGTQA